MAYSGSQVTIPLGQIGLLTDDTASALPVNSLAKANNVSFKGGRISKFHGSTKFTTAPLAYPIVALFDYWPDAGTQSLIAVNSNGDIYKDAGDGTFNSQTPIKSLGVAVTIDTKMLTGGAESAGRNKKLFILTEEAQVQIIDGPGSSTRDINFPALDFDGGNYPTFGIVYQNKMCLMGCAGSPHTLYFSTAADHENFVGQQFPKSRWQLWQRIAATPNVDETAAIQAGTASTIFTTTNNDGYIVYGLLPFNKFTFVISQAASGGTPVYTYEYWNGSAWTALTLTTTPDYSVTGSTTAEFVAPSSWVVGDGTESGGNNAYYAIRVRATTAPSSTACKATSLNVFNSNYETTIDNFAIYPGEGDKIVAAYEYRGMLFIFKKPYGVYILDGRNPDSTTWTISKYSGAFGISSPHAVLEVLGDLIVANSTGSFTSLQTSNNYGNFEAGDVLTNNKVVDYIRSQLNYAGIFSTHAIYYPERRIALWTNQSTSDSDNIDRLLAIDVATANPRISLGTKDNPNCLALRKDSEGIQRPIYGDANGDVYLMDSNTYNVGSNPYLSEFQTNYSDLGQVDTQLAGKNKIFDFIEVSYVPTGNNAFYCDILIDGDVRDTKTFNTTTGIGLDSFKLDSDKLAGDSTTKRSRLPVYSATGNRIALRFYNNGNNEGFMIERVILNFRLSSDQMYSSQV